MQRRPGSRRRLRFGLAFVVLLSGCRSTPEPYPSLPPDVSLLAVDVRFPVDFGRDPSLVQAFLVRGSVDAGTERVPELVSASFVKGSRAYLLDPEPGSYSLVAVSSAVAAPLRDYPVADGVMLTTVPGTIANAVVLPTELIRRTRTPIGPGEVAFMGALQIAEGDRINADLAFDDELQRSIAERLRPGATSASGLSGWFTLAWTIDAEKTSLRNEPADREAFRKAAIADLGASPWAQFVARAALPAVAPAPAPTRAEPGATAPAPPVPSAATAPDRAAPSAATPPTSPATREEPRVAALPPTRAPEPAARPQRRRVPGIPEDSPLAQIEIGMDWKEVQRILGEPDGRVDRTTARAWIPFYTGPGAYLREWIYEGQGRVVFSRHRGVLEVFDVVNEPGP